MSLIECAHAIRKTFEALATPSPSRYLLHLEDEVQDLRHQVAVIAGERAILQLKLEASLTPAPPPEPVKRTLPKMASPEPSSWDQYLQAEMARMEKDFEADEAAVPKEK